MTGVKPQWSRIYRPDATAWVNDAACGDADPELFFPREAGQLNKAREICRSCPVQAQCFEYAKRHREQGVWGGNLRGHMEGSEHVGATG